MQDKIHSGFTLVELIVVITILAILGTLGYLSFSGYSKDARNSNRVSDVKSIDKSFRLHITENGFLPSPDNPVDISYSGGLAWQQGEFGEDMRGVVRRVSSVPLDPIFNIPYALSVASNKRVYQLAALFEGGGLFSQSIPMRQSYALSNNAYTSYTTGNYIDYDTVVMGGGNCFILASPSIMLSDIPAGEEIINNSNQSFVYNGSPHIANSYSGSIADSASPADFQSIEVFRGCSIESLSDLGLYAAQLSTAYQQFTGDKKYEDLIYNSNSNEFLLQRAKSLRDRGISINRDVMNELVSPSPEQLFSDGFTNSDGTNLVGSHSPDTPGVWFIIPGGDSSSYSISGNALQKNNSSSSLIYPRPNPNILASNYSSSFKIDDFSGGGISAYLRYSDSDNYYRIFLESTGYTLFRKVAGSEVPAGSVLESIPDGSTIIFSVEDDTVNLTINGILKESSVLGGIDTKGNPVLSMDNVGALIDDYQLIYK